MAQSAKPKILLAHSGFRRAEGQTLSEGAWELTAEQNGWTRTGLTDVRPWRELEPRRRSLKRVHLDALRAGWR